MVEEDGLNDTFSYLDNITVAGKDQESVISINILGYYVGNGTIRPDPERLLHLQGFPPPTNRNFLLLQIGIHFAEL